MAEEASNIEIAGNPEAQAVSDKIDQQEDPVSYDILVKFDPVNQVIGGISVDPRALKTWRFVAAVLGMAKEIALLKEEQALAMQAQQRMAQQMQAAQQAQQINGKILRR